MGDHTHHRHDWPLRASDWEELVECRRCGLELLDQFINIADWVVRRVEGIHFLDDRTVRRRVSVDYTVPEGGVVMRIDGRDARILPLAMLRRQSLIKFDFTTHDGRPAPLLGLREHQALTRAVIHAWAGDPGVASRGPRGWGGARGGGTGVRRAESPEAARRAARAGGRRRPVAAD